MSQLYSEKYVKGEDSEWLVFLHGFAGNSNMWKKQIDFFKDKYNLLILDLPGHGKSNNGLSKLGIHKFEDVAEYVVKVLDENKIKVATFVCLSLGTLVFAGLLKTHPEVVKGAILCGAVAGISTMLNLCAKVFVKFIKFIPYMTLMKWFSYILLPKNSHKVIRKLFIRSAKNLGDSEFKEWCRLVVKDLNVLKHLKSIKEKVLFISGDEDYVLLSGVKEKVSGLLNAKLQIFTKCGHVCNLQKWKEFNEVSLAYLKGLL